MKTEVNSGAQFGRSLNARAENEKLNDNRASIPRVSLIVPTMRY